MQKRIITSLCVLACACACNSSQTEEKSSGFSDDEILSLSRMPSGSSSDYPGSYTLCEFTDDSSNIAILRIEDEETPHPGCVDGVAQESSTYSSAHATILNDIYGTGPRGHVELSFRRRAPDKGSILLATFHIADDGIYVTSYVYVNADNELTAGDPLSHVELPNTVGELIAAASRAKSDRETVRAELECGSQYTVERFIERFFKTPPNSCDPGPFDPGDDTDPNSPASTDDAP